MTTPHSSDHQARDTIGRFASASHGEAFDVALTGDTLLDTGNRATMAVYDLGGYEASDDGNGWYLLVDAKGDEDPMHASCPTFAAEDPDAKWYLESSDGNFYKAHPEFGHEADPQEVSAWIQETKALYEAGLSADKAALAVQDHIEGSVTHNDGDGVYLEVPTAVKDEALLAGCPVSTNDDPKATWYVQAGGGGFHVDHPTFTHDADPAEVASWISEVKTRFEQQAG